MIINHLLLSTSSIYYDPQHPPCSTYVLVSLFFTSLQVLFGEPLGLELYTHFFTQSLSSFHNTCPYHYSLFCSSTEIMLLLWFLKYCGVVNLWHSLLWSVCHTKSTIFSPAHMLWIWYRLQFALQLVADLW